MKKYKQLIKELPSKKVVFAFGRFNPPTTGHELLVKTVKKLASTGSADHAIYASKTQDAKKNPLSVDKKVQYLGKMFPSTKFVAANQNVRTYIEAVKELNKKYKNLVMVAGSDRVQAYQELLNKYNGKEFHFDTIEVVSAGERDPDADDASGMSGTKMRALAAKGDYATFKKGLPSTLRDIDGKRLMNDVRLGMGLEVFKEQVRFDIDELRDKFFKGEIYTVGQFVESDNQRYEILDRGSNYLVLVNETGETCKKWIQDVTLSEDQLQEDVSTGIAPEQITFKGYTTKNFKRTADAAKAFQDTIARASEKDPVAVLNALKSTDTYMGINDRHIAGEELTDAEIDQWKEARAKAKESLDRVGEFMHHMDYFHTHEHELEGLLTNFKESGKGEFMEELSDKTLRPTDKIKVARIIATMLGVDKVESTANPELLINTALRRIKTKTLNPEALNIVNKMLALANEMGIDYDTNLVPQKLQVQEDASVVKVDPKKTNNLAQGIMTFDDFQKLINKHTKAGHSLGHEDNDTLRKMKVKHMTESESHDRGHADRWYHRKPNSGHPAGSQEHKDYMDAYSGKHKQKLTGFKTFDKSGKEVVKEASALEKFRAAAAQREKKHDEIERKRKEDAAQGKENMSGAIDRLEKSLKESHVEFRIDHRDKVTGDHKSTMADHEAKVSDTTDKATYVKVPSHKADSFKSAMKSKHGVRVELAESNSHYEQAEQHKDDAESAKEKGDHASYHMHMADHHGSMAEWHYSKGRNDAGDKHSDKAADHEMAAHEIRRINKEEVIVEDELETSDYKLSASGRKVRAHRVKVGDNKKRDDDEDEDEMKEEVDMSHIQDHIDQQEQNIEDQLMAELDLTDEQIDHIVDSAQEEDFIEEYDDEELAIVDEETGEEIEEEQVNEETLMEVLSRQERIRARLRFAKTKGKRERKAQIALKMRSSNVVANKRARRLAIKLMKKRLLRGRDASKISLGEKERIERIIQKRKAVVGRIAMKLVPRIRQVEKARLSHTKFTKGSPNVAF
jgi:nicotinic acid mononucleotide adenylyltransferase